MGMWILIAVAVGIWLVFRLGRSGRDDGRASRGARSRSSAGEAHYVRPPYRAVSIHCGEGACAEARGVGNIRYLVDDAPLLPLPDCDAARCSCKYVHYLDRREPYTDRRGAAEPAARTPAATGPGERRRLPVAGRRASDQRQSRPVKSISPSPSPLI